MRGAHIEMVWLHEDYDGPSPRAWGSPGGIDSETVHRRSIPTCVGLTCRPVYHYGHVEVHPHVRGAHTVHTVRDYWRRGPSPRAWGSHAVEPPGSR
ncbi:conserved hypothetical protein [Thermobifida fusca YX]|nr:conserved hypothetical protein [Thermobifida fusca YX]